MSGIFLGAISILYFSAAISYIKSGNVGMGIAFISYSIANYGLWTAGT